MVRGNIESSSIARLLRGASPAAIIVLAVGLVAGCAEPLEAVPQGGGPIADRVVGGGEPITDSESVKAPVQAAVRPVYEASPFGPDIERLPNQIDLGGKEPNDDEEPGSPDPGEHPGNQPKLSVKVEPESFTLAASESLPLQARLTDSLGRLIQSRDAIWWSEDARIATVGPDGIVTARSPGFVTISVSVGGIQGNARLTVTRTAIGRVDIRGPGASEIVVGSSVQLSTVVRDSNGLPLLDRGAPSWSVDRPDIATIDHAGRLTARAPGPVRVSAVIDGVLGTRNLTAVLRFVQLVAGAEHTCGIVTTGDAYCWGTGFRGELGIGFGTVAQTPSLVAGGNLFRSLTSWSHHTCGITDSGSGAAVCWGRGADGRLGTGFTSDSWEPAKVAGGLTFDVLSAGGSSTCGLSSGVGYCWGSENGSSSPDPVPALVGFEDVQMAARQAAGIVSGQLFHFPGGGSHVMSGSSPDPVPARVLIPAMGDKDVVLSYAVGGGHACATVTLGTGPSTWCWGDGSFGQLGDGYTSSSSTSAVQISGSLALHGLVAGEDHTCGLSTNGDAWCWGDNSQGQLGSGSDHAMAAAPVVVSGVRFSSLAAGRDHTCGISVTGEAWCWGRNTSQQLGAGSSSISNYPVLVSSQHAP